MKLRAFFSSGRLLRRLRSADANIREAAVDAAADALHGELARRGENFITTQRVGAKRVVGSADPNDAARELGTLEQTPLPWLAPVLPLALEPMRAAADARVREIFATHAGNKNAAARAVSTLEKRRK